MLMLGRIDSIALRGIPAKNGSVCQSVVAGLNLPSVSYEIVVAF